MTTTTTYRVLISRSDLHTAQESDLTAKFAGQRWFVKLDPSIPGERDRVRLDFEGPIKNLEETVIEFRASSLYNETVTMAALRQLVGRSCTIEKISGQGVLLGNVLIETGY